MQVSIGEAISQAFARTGIVLFKPFRLGKWLVVAFAAAMTLVGVGPPPVINIIINVGARLLPTMNWGDALDWYQAHQVAIIAGMCAAVIVLFPIYLACRWVSSRGYFMFYDALVTNEAQIKAPWRTNRVLGNSLMKMWLIWDLIWFNILLVIVSIACGLAFPDFKHYLIEGEYTATAWTIAAVVFGTLGLLLTGVALWFVRSFLFLLVIPVMYVRQLPARPAAQLAWRELFLPNKGTCLVYFLTHIGIALVKMTWAGFGFIVLCVVTLCLAYVALFIPIVGNYPVALANLPVMTFEGAFQLYFLSQFGSAYQVSWSVPVQGGFPVILDSPPAPPA